MGRPVTQETLERELADLLIALGVLSKFCIPVPLALSQAIRSYRATLNLMRKKD